MLHWPLHVRINVNVPPSPGKATVVGETDNCGSISAFFLQEENDTIEIRNTIKTNHIRHFRNIILIH